MGSSRCRCVHNCGCCVLRLYNLKYQTLFAYYTLQPFTLYRGAFLALTVAVFIHHRPISLSQDCARPPRLGRLPAGQHLRRLVAPLVPCQFRQGRELAQLRASAAPLGGHFRANGEAVAPRRVAHAVHVVQQVRHARERPPAARTAPHCADGGKRARRTAHGSRGRPIERLQAKGRSAGLGSGARPKRAAGSP